MRVYSFLTLFLLSAFLMFGCKQNATDMDGELTVDETVTEQAAYGYQINDIATTSNEMEAINADPADVGDVGVNGAASMTKLRKQAQTLAKQALSMNIQIPALTKVSGDSAIYSGEDSTANGKKMRWAWYYNMLTGKARYVYVIYQFPEAQKMAYDSMEIVMDMGFPFGSSDGTLESFYQIQLFKENFFIQSIESQLSFSNYMNGEAQSITGTTETKYQDGRKLTSQKTTISWNTNNTGTVRHDFFFADGTSAYATYTFNADHTGTFEKKRRDGTIVTGTFNQLEDDGYGSYTALVDFPNGFYLDKIEKAATIWLQGIDSVYTATYAEKIFFGSGKIDSSNSSITVEETEAGMVTTISATKPNGAHGTIVLTEAEDGVSTMTGFWITWDGHYILVSAEYFLDGSSHMHYEVYASEEAYNNGDDPIVVADYNFNGELGGDGTLTKDGKTYQITFDGSGQGTISDGTNSKTFNMYF